MPFIKNGITGLPDRHVANSHDTNSMKRAFPLLLGLCFLLLSLPCSCMADAPIQPSKSELPCHSHPFHSTDSNSLPDSRSDQSDRKDGTCCCSLDLNMINSDLILDAILVKHPEPQKQFSIKLIPHFSSLASWSNSDLYRGSPSKPTAASVHSDRPLALIQRWLI